MKRSLWSFGRTVCFTLGVAVCLTTNGRTQSTGSGSSPQNTVDTPRPFNPGQNLAITHKSEPRYGAVAEV
jgi:hypothetical protein